MYTTNVYTLYASAWKIKQTVTAIKSSDESWYYPQLSNTTNGYVNTCVIVILCSPIGRHIINRFLICFHSEIPGTTCPPGFTYFQDCNFKNHPDIETLFFMLEEALWSIRHEYPFIGLVILYKGKMIFRFHWYACHSEMVQCLEIPRASNVKTMISVSYCANTHVLGQNWYAASSIECRAISSNILPSVNFYKNRYELYFS